MEGRTWVQEISGEGLVGLTRGFMYAGASRVMASLWKIDDRATAELMGLFYQAMVGQGNETGSSVARRPTPHAERQTLAFALLLGCLPDSRRVEIRTIKALVPATAYLLLAECKRPDITSGRSFQ